MKTCRDRVGAGLCPPPLPHHRTCGSAFGDSRRIPETAIGIGESLEAQVAPVGVGQGALERCGACNSPVPLARSGPFERLLLRDAQRLQVAPPCPVTPPSWCPCRAYVREAPSRGPLGQRACKPDPVVSDHLSPGAGAPGGRRLTALRPTWTSPGRVCGPAWPCTGRGLPGRRVAAAPVRSYRTISPLPVRGSRVAAPSAVCFCGTFPRVSPGGRYPPPRPVVSGLSSRGFLSPRDRSARIADGSAGTPESLDH